MSSDEKNSPETQEQEIQNSLGLAIHHHTAGRLPDAEHTVQQILQANPNHPDALHLLGLFAHKERKYEIATNFIEQSITVNPYNADAHNNLGIVKREQRKLEDAYACFQKAIDIKPDYRSARCNLGAALAELGRISEAVQFLQNSLDKDPGNTKAFDMLIDILNHHLPEETTPGSYGEAQMSLQKVIPTYGDSLLISDEIVQQSYQKCRNVIDDYKWSSERSISQVWRGITSSNWKDTPYGDCERNMVVFNTFNNIPEYCFNCYKVSIKPRTVMELFKLMIVFDRLKLPKDNTRKCFVEVRPYVEGAYKGLIYCRGLNEAKDILKVTQKVVRENISDKISLSVQRGCSEFPIPYPEYSYNEEKGDHQMEYIEEWRENENYTDNNLIASLSPDVFSTHNHIGFSFYDAIAMSYWLSYAAMIGDQSHLLISRLSTPDWKISRRPPHQPVENDQ